ncbi:MAG: zf-HC2 domain-containing protein [Blautia sp.]|nr:zf-HC2 domain-containing protein [Blautia sp.]MDY3999820.1 zf-HC2 domain-containing protein [Blautia sp.]
MDCRAAEGMVTRYISHTLSLEELEEFLEHIESCSSCYEELETYFIVHEAMLQLDDEDEDAMLDFKHLLEQDIRKTRRYIYKKKVTNILSAILFVILIGVVTFFFVFIITQIKQFI